MKEQNKKVSQKLGNKGFTLIELIIVIAIIAILAVTLAPQLMKYIGKSKDSSDLSNKSTIESNIHTALTNEDVYSDVLAAANPLTLKGTANGTTVTGGVASLNAEVATIIKKWPKIQDKTKNKFWVITIEHSGTEIGEVKVETSMS